MKTLKTIYILHITPLEGVVWHYVGITQRKVWKRVKQHITGYGNPKVFEAVQYGASVRYEIIHDCATEDMERVIGAWPEDFISSNICPVCTGQWPRWSKRKRA